MAVLTMVYGQSGSGKSTSLRNFKNGEVAIYNVSKKPLPFRTQLAVKFTDKYDEIKASIKKGYANGIRIFVVDDATYLMANQVFAKADIGGYGKWTDLAKDFADFLKFCVEMPMDARVYIIGHTDIDTNGREKFKSYGKMLDDALCTVEARFTIVLKAFSNDGQYFFSTRTNGQDTVKSPMEMFPDAQIENDLKDVDSVICGYYGIGDEKKGDEEGNE